MLLAAVHLLPDSKCLFSCVCLRVGVISHYAHEWFPNRCLALLPFHPLFVTRPVAFCHFRVRVPKVRGFSARPWLPRQGFSFRMMIWCNASFHYCACIVSLCNGWDLCVPALLACRRCGGASSMKDCSNADMESFDVARRAHLHTARRRLGMCDSDPLCGEPDSTTGGGGSASGAAVAGTAVVILHNSTFG